MSTSVSKVYPFKAIDGLAIHFITNSLSQNVLRCFNVIVIVISVIVIHNVACLMCM